MKLISLVTGFVLIAVLLVLRSLPAAGPRVRARLRPPVCVWLHTLHLSLSRASYPLHSTRRAHARR